VIDRLVMAMAYHFHVSMQSISTAICGSVLWMATAQMPSFAWR